MTISFSKWVKESVSTLRNGDRSLAARLLRPIYLLYVGIFLTATRYIPYGTNVYDRDWDALVVLDACRVDAIREVKDEYDFIEDVEAVTSVGSTSFEWMNQTFTRRHEEEIARTAYVTRNQFSESVLGNGGDTSTEPIPFGPRTWPVVDPEDFAYLEEAWKADFDPDSRWGLDGGVSTRVHPRYPTERTIETGRNREIDRLVVHYIYPHDPYPLADEKLQPNFDAAMKSGDATYEEAWDAYVDNLRFVLDEVELLLKNLDAEKVVITADHGEAFGEYGFYRHPVACPIEEVRKVPWVETTAEDTGSYEPTAPHPEEAAEMSVEDRLEQLGYR